MQNDDQLIRKGLILESIIHKKEITCPQEATIRGRMMPMNRGKNTVNEMDKNTTNVNPASQEKKGLLNWLATLHFVNNQKHQKLELVVNGTTMYITTHLP